MFKSTSTKVISLLALTAVMLAACGKDDEAATPSAAVADSGLLQYIPADAPYVFVTLEPFPDDVMDSLEPMVDRVLVGYREVLRVMAAQKASEMSEEERASADVQQAEAVIEELTGLMSVQALRDAGIARDSLGAFYGNGILPVMRFELSDEALFEAAIARIEAEAGHTLPVAEVADQSYRYLDAEGLRIIVAVLDGQAVFGMVPSTFDESQVGRALGLTRPEKSIADTDVLQGLIGKYGFTNHAIAFVDVPLLVERFVGQPTGLDADLMASVGSDVQLSEVCKSEFREMAGVMPRLVAGYTAVATDRFESSAIFELRQDLASELTALAAPVPGLGGDKSGLMSFGMSLDIAAARKFIETRLEAMEADPYECEHFADLQASVATTRQSLNQPVPPMVYDFKGFNLVIDAIEGLDIANQTPPTSIDGSFLLAMDNAAALVAMGAMFSPELAALNLQADGNPVELNLPQLQMMGMSAFAAMNEGALAISLGEGAETKAGGLLQGETRTPPPFASFSVDAARYYAFLGEAIAAGEAGAEDVTSPEMQDALVDMMNAVAEFYDRMWIDVVLTDNGIELRSVETFK